MSGKKLQLDQLNAKMQGFNDLKNVQVPAGGWIKTIRIAIGMSLIQLGKRLEITKQSAKEIETRESDGSLTLKALREVANAMDMQLVYGFVPNDGSLEALIERKAKEVATKIVMRTSASMKLEDQENTERRIKKAIEERTDELKKEMSKILWD
jgi:predicted DNA-binding mobile mystery protein A